MFSWLSFIVEIAIVYFTKSSSFSGVKLDRQNRTIWKLSMVFLTLILNCHAVPHSIHIDVCRSSNDTVLVFEYMNIVENIEIK